VIERSERLDFLLKPRQAIWIFETLQYRCLAGLQLGDYECLCLASFAELSDYFPLAIDNLAHDLTIVA
jgi:hypothetical protein